MRTAGRGQVGHCDRTSELPMSALVVVGTDHRLADPEPLKAMLEACQRAK